MHIYFLEILSSIYSYLRIPAELKLFVFVTSARHYILRIIEQLKYFRWLFFSINFQNIFVLISRQTFNEFLAVFVVCGIVKLKLF
jgi:hypothetical protein